MALNQATLEQLFVVIKLKLTILSPTFCYFCHKSMYINEDDLVLVAPVSGNILDNYLAEGYYRYRQQLFTTFYIEYLGTLHDVFWLRTDVSSVKLSSSYNKILRQNKSFCYTITPLQITPEMEDLFALYREYVSFEHAQSIYDNLYGDSPNNIFESFVIKVYDGDMLIAFGCFDKGEKSIAGILNAYHPNYKKYSLGKFLILLKLQFCIKNNITYYYTGYIGIGLKHFDYKTFPDENAVQVLLHEPAIWIPYNKVGKKGLEEYGLLAQIWQANESQDDLE